MWRPEQQLDGFGAVDSEVVVSHHIGDRIPSPGNIPYLNIHTPKAPQAQNRPISISRKKGMPGLFKSFLKGSTGVLILKFLKSSRTHESSFVSGEAL